MADATLTENGTTRRGGLMELGQTGLRHQGGILQEEWLRQLRTHDQRMRAFTEMGDNDPIVGASLYALEMLIRNVTWEMDAADDSNEALKAADWMKGALFDDMSHSWPDTLSDVLSMLKLGFSYHNIVYKFRRGENRRPGMASKFTDGKWGWRKLPIRAQETLHKWEFDEEGGVQAMIQHDPFRYTTVAIPISRALLFRIWGHKGNPEGRSILRNAYVPWLRKKRIEEIQGIGIERDLAGLPVGWVPPNIAQPVTDAERAANAVFKRLVTNIRRDEQDGVLMPLHYDANGNKSYDLTLLSTGGSRQFDTRQILEWYNREILMSTLTDVILLGHEKVGSFALSDSKTNLMSLAVGAILQSIEGVFNRHAIPRLWRLNAMPMALMPRLKAGDVETIDLDAFSNFILRLSQAGFDVFDVENEIRRRAGLPQRDLDADPPLHRMPSEPGAEREALQEEIEKAISAYGLEDVMRRLQHHEPITDDEAQELVRVVGKAMGAYTRRAG